VERSRAYGFRVEGSTFYLLVHAALCLAHLPVHVALCLAHLLVHVELHGFELEALRLSIWERCSTSEMMRSRLSPDDWMISKYDRCSAIRSVCQQQLGHADHACTGTLDAGGEGGLSVP